MPASIRLVRAVTCALSVVPGATLAAQFDYSLYAGVEHSNNINLSSQDPISENVLIPGLNFTYQQQGSTLQANVVGALEYRDYTGGKFDNQTQTQLAGLANWTILPQRLDFSVQDYAAVQPVDSLASDAPGNQQQTNVLAFGPTMHLRFGDALRGQVELRYVNSYASKVDDFNSSRGAAAVRVFREISPTDLLSANVETQHVNFENHGAPNYDRNEVYAAYSSKLARFDIDAAAGWSQLKFDHSSSDSNPLLRLTLNWRPTERSTFSLAGAYQYSDAAQDMLSQGQTPTTSVENINTGNTVIDAQVYQERLLQATYALHTERLTLSITPLFRKLHYLNDATFDQTGRGGDINLAYLLRPQLTLSALATTEQLTYQTLDRRDRTIRFGLDLNRQWTRHWSAHISIDRQRRNSDVSSQSYRETRIFLGVVFRR
ncbi:outer membrane beta-barrel protein [Rhodanobacter sp. Col0626]|uniref:outer membrane beta-barrel protein n=1 Tax=Rhodanobacter sp. Col0626 TaxID=3415679 RepID=UPI003CEC9B68